MHRLGSGVNSEHVAEYPDASVLVVLLLLHDFPDPGKFPAFACSSPPSDTWGLKSLGTQAPGFGGCLRARPRHRARAPLDPRAGNAVTSTWRECRHDHLDTAPLNHSA